MSRANDDQNKEVLDRWFVQIKGQIVGPMPGNKILARVISDELTVMSRVSSDRKNWNAICNVSFFEELVNSRIRAYTGKTDVVGQQGPGGDDSTPLESDDMNYNAVHTNAVEGLYEQLDHARQLEELTANIQKLNAIKKEILLKRKTIVVERERDGDEVHEDDQNIFIPKPAKKFSLKEIFSGNVRHRKLAIASAALFILGLIGTIGYSAYETHQEQVALEIKLKAEAEARAKSEYEKAALATDGNVINKNASAEELLALAESYAKEKKHSAGQAAIKQALRMQLDVSNRARAHAISAAISLAVGDLDTAAVQYTESLQLIELYGTLHAVGVLNVRKGNFEEAERFFLKALQLPNSSSSDRAITLIHLFETALVLDKKTSIEKTTGDPQPTMIRTAAALSMINEVLPSVTNGKDRLLLVKAMGEYYTANKEGFQTSAIELIDEPVDLATAIIQSDLEDEFTQWHRLVRHCALVYNKPPVSGFNAAFYAACLTRSHGAAQALPFAKYAFTLNSKDSIFGALYSSVLFSSGDIEAAEKILSENPSFADSSKLARFVLTEISNKRSPAETKNLQDSTLHGPTEVVK
jgi:tetratricopeptide (TPR) repeat protein